MSLLETRVVDLLRSGRFADALSDARKIDGTKGGASTRVVTIEALERTGHSDEATAAIERLLQSGSVEPRLRSRLLTTRGVIQLELGHPDEAATSLTQARQLSADGKFLEELVWAELRLLLAEFERTPNGDSAHLLAALKKHTMQLGDSTASIALHLFVCEVEAKKGLLVSSQRHLKTARALLSTYSNPWLEGLASICDFCLAYLVGDLAAAEQAATDALRFSARSGHARTELAALIDIAHIRLRQGKLDETNRLFRRALSLTKMSPRCREGIFDGLAQLALNRGEIVESERLISELFTPAFPEHSYPKLWSFPTRVRLHMARGQWAEARELARDGLQNARERGNTSLLMRLRLLSAECSGRLGDLEAAGYDLLAAWSEDPEPSLELVAESNRVVGELLTIQCDWRGAAVAVKRARRVLSAIGHAHDAERLTTVQTDDTSNLSVCSDRGDVWIARAAALFDQAGRPDLLGQELIELFTTIGCVRAIALIATDADESSHVMLATGWSKTPNAGEICQSAALARIELGMWRQQRWQLALELLPGVAARSAFVAVRSLVSSCRTVDSARRENRERSALWSMDPVEDATHGVFASESMLDLVRTIRRVAQTPVTILLTGETGTGKDILARLIHEYSPRANKMFVPFNCTAVPREMLDSQLFGHRRGAFTGAQEQSPGVIRGAVGGTLFLDEIGEIGVEAQVKLLRFLESTEVHPIGESHPVKVDVRVVAATNRDLDALVRDGLFREDLFYRLNVIRLRVPPLRERREEIPAIVDHYLTRLGNEFKKGPLSASAETMEYLLLYSWPGNVRQLANELRRAAALADTDAVIMPEHLSAQITASRRTVPASEREILPTEVVVRIDQPLAPATEHLERKMIQHAMTLAHGHMDQAAQLLGISRKGLYLKRQRLGLEPATPGTGALGEKPSDKKDDSLPS